jgi:hypothetical protein
MNNNKTYSTRKSLILVAFILLKFLLQYLLYNPYYDLQRDEYLYLDQANHPAWGYVSVPPVTAWFSAIIQFLGNSVFWVRFFPALIGVLTMVVVWKAIEELKGNLYALVLGATCILLSVLVRLDFLFQPNSLDVLCWTAFYFTVIKYINTQKSKWFFIGAIVFAIGFLNKYNIVFLIMGLLPATLLSEHRNIFTKKKFYYSLLLALVLILPNLTWQYQSNFPVYFHMKELAATQLIHVNRWNFLKEQLYYFIGALPVIIASFYALLFYKPFKKYRVFFWAIIFTLIVFIYFKAKAYYAIGLYPIYISFGAVFLGNILKEGKRKYWQPFFLVIPVLLYILLFNIVFRVKSPGYIIKHTATFKKLGMLRWEDGKDHTLPQDFADMLGWKELALKVDSVLNQLPNKDQTLILCDNYGQAGAINYYSKDKKIKAVSFNADYINWFNPDAKIYNLIRVKEFDGSEDELKTTSPYFDTAYIAGTVTDSLAREYGTTIFVFSKPKIDVKQRLKEEIEKHKKHEEK